MLAQLMFLSSVAPPLAPFTMTSCFVFEPPILVQTRCFVVERQFLSISWGGCSQSGLLVPHAHEEIIVLTVLGTYFNALQ
jgi:hypothetical protein